MSDLPSFIIDELCDVIDEFSLKLEKSKQECQELRGRLCAWCGPDFGNNHTIYNHNGSEYKLLNDKATVVYGMEKPYAVLIQEGTGDYKIVTAEVFRDEFVLKK